MSERRNQPDLYKPTILRRLCTQEALLAAAVGATLLIGSARGWLGERVQDYVQTHVCDVVPDSARSTLDICR